MGSLALHSVRPIRQLKVPCCHDEKEQGKEELKHESWELNLPGN